MPITDKQSEAAQIKQFAAAQDGSKQIRLLAGPGTGKSSSIEERVRWLLSEGIDCNNIYAVSFTRAASMDLRRRVAKYCENKGQKDGDRVSVTTLHSLALTALRKGGFIESYYPVSPLVLDDWELGRIYDAEFAEAHKFSEGRCKTIRTQNEAFWSTGDWNPANYTQPDQPVTEQERNAFKNFHQVRKQIYACVLPGEIVRMCVELMESEELDPVSLLQIEHLIVDEFQDLNPIDIKFIHSLMKEGVTAFIAGDDDQSIYSFRFASPEGIQTLPSVFPDISLHELPDCFRCAPSILDIATELIEAYPLPDRIPKTLNSLWANAEPPVQGIVHRWNFSRDVIEAREIAKTCRNLVQSGIPPREILILLGNKPRLLGLLQDAFGKIDGVDLESPREEGYKDTEAGRLILGLLRVVTDPDDYVALRIIMGQLPGVGSGTCNSIAESVLYNKLNYRNIFYNPLPANLFKGKPLGALNRSREICEQISTWKSTDTLEDRREEIFSLINNIFGKADAETWNTEIADLPVGITLEELRNYLAVDTDEQQDSLLTSVYERLGITIPDEGVLPQRVRAMTMHGAKGLSASIVFIPGLEEDLLPNKTQKAAAGLIFEAARLLYVSITRARVACIMSFATKRIIYGKEFQQSRSRFNKHLGGKFVYREIGLNQPETDEILKAYELYNTSS